MCLFPAKLKKEKKVKLKSLHSAVKTEFGFHLVAAEHGLQLLSIQKVSFFKHLSGSLNILSHLL